MIEKLNKLRFQTLIILLVVSACDIYGITNSKSNNSIKVENYEKNLNFDYIRSLSELNNKDAFNQQSNLRKTYRETTDSTKYVFEDFENAKDSHYLYSNRKDKSVIKNPMKSDDNKSSHVGKLSKGDYLTSISGVTVNLSEPIRFSKHSQFSIKVLTPEDYTSIEIQLESKEGSVSLKTIVEHSNIWNTLVFDVPTEADVSYNAIKLFFNKDKKDSNTEYYYDDFAVTNGELTSNNPPLLNKTENTAMLEDFESVPPSLYNFYVKSVVVDNYKSSGINTSNKILRFRRPYHAATYGGTAISIGSYTFKEGDKIRVKAWSPKSGIILKIKLEKNDLTQSIETDKIITTTNQWVSLDYDFQALAPSMEYNKITIFFDYGKEPGEPAAVVDYFIDDFELITNTSPGNNQDNSLAGAHPEEVLAGPDPVNSVRLITSNYNIKEGIVNNDEAFQNRLELIKAMEDAKTNGYNTFIIDDFDAYFNVTKTTNSLNRLYAWQEAIVIPEGMTLLMGENCHLRVQPNNSGRYVLLGNGTHDNVTIKGGFLHGDRNEHTYSGSGTDEFGHVIELIGLKNGIVENVTMQDGNGDGLDIKALKFSYQSDFDQSENITINHCTFDSNRRNNLSITGGTQILVQNSRFLNAGITTPNSNGTDPKAAIDVEPYKERSSSTGELIDYEIAEDITIRNNVEIGSASQSFISATGRAVTIENNDVTSTIGFGYSDNMIIRNNNIIGNGYSTGIRAGEIGSRVFENKIYNNKIENFDRGFSIEGNGHDIHDNIVNNFDYCGIETVGFVSNSTIDNNIFKSARPNSIGLLLYVSKGNNVSISNNEFEAVFKPLKIFAFNEFEPQNQVSITSNIFNTPNGQGNIGRANGIFISSNTINSGIRIGQNANNIEINDNIINSGNVFAIEILSTVQSLTLLRNSITTSKYTCIQIRDEEPADYTENSNSCN